MEPTFGTQGTGKTLDRALTAIFKGYRCRTPTTVPARGRPGPRVLNIPSAPRIEPMRSLHPDDPDGSRLAGLQARIGRIAVHDTELVPLSVLGD